MRLRNVLISHQPTCLLLLLLLTSYVASRFGETGKTMSAQAVTVPCYKLFHCCISQKLSQVSDNFFPMRYSNMLLKTGRCKPSARSVSPLHSALPLELMELPPGCFSPQMGTAGGDPPPRAGVTPSPTLTLTPSTPCLLLLCCATAQLQPSACRTVLALSGRGGVRGSSRRGRTTVMMSQAHICPQRRAGGGAALNCLHTAAPSHPSSPPPHGDQETDVVK